MSSGDQSTFTIGQATGLPRQSEAPPKETGPLAAVRATAAPAPPVDPDKPEAPAVRLRRLAGVAAWALVLVLAGVASAIVGLFQIFGDGPDWFTPAFISCGVAGMMLAMMAFATVRFRGVPWMFMAASTITLLAAFVMLRLA
ncbi:hypothetical protein [Glycomyces harbinensis]|uniref:Uncharacterized protein n=1 Tax=Glycomyces harbinensis TaxID=58114 RepID=A0A1G7CCP8_9ACTN|nr:hypothetical protein [Glycomyces harbinensis]SDE37108.1 hypothetical protein SAMN05216270_11986 [Glycomyces harbinensis]